MIDVDAGRDVGRTVAGGGGGGVLVGPAGLGREVLSDISPLDPLLDPRPHRSIMIVHF